MSCRAPKEQPWTLSTAASECQGDRPEKNTSLDSFVPAGLLRLVQLEADWDWLYLSMRSKNTQR